MAAHGRGGLGCWDWTTMAPCTGGDYVDGWIDHDTQAESLPMAYGAACDGSCVVGPRRPGARSSPSIRPGTLPCTSLGAGTEPRTIDLRDQRCDDTVGGATWREVALADSAPGELAAVTVTVRDAATGAVLATKDIAGSKLDLSGIDPKAHPAITVGGERDQHVRATRRGTDSVPPRIRVAWKADPRQLCFETTTPGRVRLPARADRRQRVDRRLGGEGRGDARRRPRRLSHEAHADADADTRAARSATRSSRAPPTSCARARAAASCSRT